MNKHTLLILAVLGAVAFSGCGVSKSEHNKALAERDQLKKRADELTAQVANAERAKTAAELGLSEIQAKWTQAGEEAERLKGENATLDAKVRELEQAKANLEKQVAGASPQAPSV